MRKLTIDFGQILVNRGKYLFFFTSYFYYIWANFWVFFGKSSSCCDSLFLYGLSFLLSFSFSSGGKNDLYIIVIRAMTKDYNDY